MEQVTYRIGEAAEIVGVKPYVLRFWESEFPQIAPNRTAKGQRHYSEEDIRLLKRIKYLLYDQGLTIEGARKLLSSSDQADPDVARAAASFDREETTDEACQTDEADAKERKGKTEREEQGDEHEDDQSIPFEDVSAFLDDMRNSLLALQKLLSVQDDENINCAK